MIFFNVVHEHINKLLVLLKSDAKVSKKNDMTKQLTYFNIKW